MTPDKLEPYTSPTIANAAAYTSPLVSRLINKERSNLLVTLLALATPGKQEPIVTPTASLLTFLDDSAGISCRPGRDGCVITVHEDEPSSLIAHTLLSNEYAQYVNTHCQGETSVRVHRHFRRWPGFLR
jgi:hypothetical protein